MIGDAGVEMLCTALAANVTLEVWRQRTASCTDSIVPLEPPFGILRDHGDWGLAAGNRAAY